MTDTGLNWDEIVQLHQSPAPGDFTGNFDPVADEEIQGPLGHLVNYIVNMPDNLRPYMSLILTNGDELDADEVARLAQSESYRLWKDGQAA